MIGSTRSINVYARTAPTDLRKGFNGLYGLVERELGRDPMSGDVYLVVYRRRKAAKALLYDGTGLCIYAKRLAQGSFACLWRDDGSSSLSLSMSELALFLEGADLTAHLPLSPDRVDEPVLHADETSWRLMIQKGGTLKWWVWTLASDRLAYFLIQPSRSKKEARRLLRDFDGVLICDGYSAYAALERLADRGGDLGLEGVEHPNFDLAGCWSHARRGFLKAVSQSEEASLFLDDIDELFAIEQQAKEEAAQNQVELIALRSKLRRERSRQIVEGLYERADHTSRLSGTAFDKALNDLVNQRRPLERFWRIPGSR